MSDEPLHSRQAELHPPRKHTGDTRYLLLEDAMSITLSEGKREQGRAEQSRAPPGTRTQPATDGRTDGQTESDSASAQESSSAALTLLPASRPENRGMTCHNLKLDKVIIQLTFLDLNSDKRCQRAVALWSSFV